MNFDVMRLIAALLVVVSHTFPLSGRPPLIIPGVEDLGALGVSIFFVISGYLVSASYLRDPKHYLANRLLRIEPGLIAALSLTVIALGFITTAAPADYWPKAATYVARNAFFIPTEHALPGVFADNPVAGVVNGVLWTLRLEVAFYAVLMLTKAKPRLVGALAVACAAVWVGMVVARVDWTSDRATRIAFLTARCGMLFFAAAAAQAGRWRIPTWAGALALVSFPWVGAPALAVAVLGLHRPGRTPFDLSYGVYIYAFPVQQILASHGRLNLASAILCVLPLAAMSWFLVERPALALKAPRQKA